MYRELPIKMTRLIKNDVSLETIKVDTLQIMKIDGESACTQKQKHPE
jgi:hypothetical protein